MASLVGRSTSKTLKFSLRPLWNQKPKLLIHFLDLHTVKFVLPLNFTLSTFRILLFNLYKVFVIYKTTVALYTISVKKDLMPPTWYSTEILPFFKEKAKLDQRVQWFCFQSIISYRVSKTTIQVLKKSLRNHIFLNWQNLFFQFS